MRARAWVPLIGVCGIALARALLAAPPEQPVGGLDETSQRAAFRAIVSDESTMRREAAKTFPTDLWSRDDAFHEKELARARDWAGKHRARLGEVLHAVDDGLHGHWTHDNHAPLIATVPPCRPRAIY